MSENVKIIFLDKNQLRKENPLTLSENNALEENANSFALKIQSGVQLVYQKNGSKDYAVGLFDDNSNLLASEYGSQYYKMGLQVVELASKSN